MSEDYQTIIRNGIHVELAVWLRKRSKRALPDIHWSEERPRRRLSRILTDDTKEILVFTLGVIVLGGLLLLALSPYSDYILSWI